MNDSGKFTGLGVALATPFSKSGEIDYGAFERLVAFTLGNESGDAFWESESGGADFLVVLGSTGEGPTVEPEERRELIALSTRDSKVPIVVGAGSNSTKAAVRLTEETFELGADAVLSVVPFYNKPTPDGLFAHFSAVAKAAQGKPIIVYNVPGRTGLNLAPSALSRLWSIPNIVAVKESSGNLAQIAEIARTLPEGKIILSGDDALALPAISLGAEGLISVAGNILPRRLSALVAAARAGERLKAARFQRELLPVMDALFAESNPIPLKAALKAVGICEDTVRLPLTSASKETRAKLAAAIAALPKF